MTEKTFVYAASLNFFNNPPDFLTPGVLAGYRRTTSQAETPTTILAVVPMLDPGNGNPPLATEGLSDNTDNEGPVLVGSRLVTISRLTGFDPIGGQWDRVRVFSDNTENQPVAMQGLLAVANRGQVFNGATYNLARGASAAHLALFSGVGVPLSADPGEWAVNAAPAAATIATASRAAGAVGERHVCRSLCFTIAAVAAQAPLEFVVRDGASGAGAILFRGRLSCVVGDSRDITLSGLNIVGSAATAMTVESVAAPAATNFATVSMTGYSAV